jgi:hypothetical protein
MKEKILEFMRYQEDPLSPFSIAKSLHFKGSSTRARLSELSHQGLLERVGPGLYSITPRDGVGNPRIQNFLAVAHPSPALTQARLKRLEGLGLVRFDGREYQHLYEFQGPPQGDEGQVILRLRFGLKRNKITWSIKAALGLDFYGFMFCYGLVKCVLARCGIVIPEEGPVDPEKPALFLVRQAEFLHDRFSIAMDGVKALTLRDFQGNLEKIYNKDYGVRREIRATDLRPVHELMAFYQGGLPTFMVAQASYDIAREVGRNTEAIKYLNKNQAELTRLNNEILKALWRILDERKGGPEGGP